MLFTTIWIELHIIEINEKKMKDDHHMVPLIVEYEND